MQAASIGLQSASSVMSVVSGFQEGAAADAQGKAQEQQILNQGLVASNVAAARATDRLRAGRRELGTMKAAVASSGSDAGGSALDVLVQSSTDVARDAENEIYKGKTDMYDAQNQGAFARLRGKMARAAAINSGIKQGIGSLSGAAQGASDAGWF